MRPRGHLSPAALDPHAGTRERFVLHDERNEFPLAAAGLDVAQRLDARELLLQRAAPAEPGRDRVGLGSDVLAVQREARLEAQRIAGAQTAGRDTAGEHAVPE